MCERGGPMKMKFLLTILSLTLFNSYPLRSWANSIDGTSIYNLSTQWTTQDKREIKLEAFRGHPVVIAMIYTSCKDACPLLVSDMKMIEKETPTDKLTNIKFVLASFDPDTDSPEKLTQYAKAHDLDLKRWTLLHGSKENVRELSALLDIRYKKLRNGDFSHSSIITILDSEGKIQHQQIGLNQDSKETVEILRRFVK